MKSAVAAPGAKTGRAIPQCGHSNACYPPVNGIRPRRGKMGDKARGDRAAQAFLVLAPVGASTS